MSALCQKQTWCCSGNGRKGQVGGFRRGFPVREAWTNRGRVLRRLGEPNVGRDYGSHQLAAVPQSVLHDGSPKPRDLLRAFRTAYRSDTHVRQATFGTLRIPLASPVVRTNDAAYASIDPDQRFAQCPLIANGGHSGNAPCTGNCTRAVWRFCPQRLAPTNPAIFSGSFQPRARLRSGTTPNSPQPCVACARFARFKLTGVPLSPARPR